MTYKYSKNLAQLLVKAKLNENITTDLPTYPLSTFRLTSFPAKNMPCRNQQCGTCPQLTNRSHYYSYQTKHHYKIPDIYSCDTNAAIYLLQCQICHKQYLGETHVTIRNRMTHHRNKALNTRLVQQGGPWPT